MAKKKGVSLPSRPRTSAEIRQSFLDFFAGYGHTIVPSASLVPGTDQTLLFTNAGMVQFKDVFLGTGSRPYTRVADSQKCMRVAGKHNDLDDVGRDDTHHTFFEMLGNWSFGDYYKQDAISWAWELLTDIWGLPKEHLYATCFEDELGEIPRDDEAANHWREQPGFNPDHVLFFGREENFWEMAETGPCGPDSEIHLDRGIEHCDKTEEAGHICQVNGDCARYLELWNLVFIQYNRTSKTDLNPLPKQHVDTGLGFERIVSVIQGVDSNYKTDLFTPLIATIQDLAGHRDADRLANFTPYRVIADHARAASFLIADGVVPGNIGRNYVCRMIIRRASRFGSKLGLDEPFLANVAQTVIEGYGEVYPELQRNQTAITQTITDEERRFQRTLDIGTSRLEAVLDELATASSDIVPGNIAFDLYATYGLPLEITRDIAREHGADTDEVGFLEAMETHRLVSSSDEDLFLEGEHAEFYQELYSQLQAEGQLGADGVIYDPYNGYVREGVLLAIIKDQMKTDGAQVQDEVAVVLSETPFYVEAGGQVSDTGRIRSKSEPKWEIEIEDSREPISGLILHQGIVRKGEPRVGDDAIASVDRTRRWDIMRNHTATHLLHAALREVLGKHVRQAGSLVAPDRLRFDFTHPQAMTFDEIHQVETLVNEEILANHELQVQTEPHQTAVDGGAMALFGEAYAETVRTISIGEEKRFSYELCGGTHVGMTGTIGTFLIMNEGSVAAGIRRIEALTGRGAQAIIQSRFQIMSNISEKLGSDYDTIEARLETLLEEHKKALKEIDRQQQQRAIAQFQDLKLDQSTGVPILTGIISDVDAEMLRRLTDRFQGEHPSGVAVLASIVENRPIIIASVSEDLVQRGLHAGELVKAVAKNVGGGGGGKATLAQAGGQKPEKLPEAIAVTPKWVRTHLQE